MADEAVTQLGQQRFVTKEELCLYEPPPEPCGIVIFGASGDLTHRKLLPSLYFLSTQKKMPPQFYILGVARTKMTDAAFRDSVKKSLADVKEKKQLEPFLERCFYISGDYNSAALYKELSSTLASLDQKFKLKSRHLFYLSVPPVIYLPIIKNLRSLGHISSGAETSAWTRVVVEKPFGDSLESAQTLNKNIKEDLTERQIYRIDHYLGKETVQNILMFRFANAIFETVWDRSIVDNIQITAFEELGVEHRAGYYDQAGVWRDMFQNHLLQLLALIAMEPPLNMEADELRNKKVEVLRSVRIPADSEILSRTVSGQYGKGNSMPAYLEEEGVPAKSRTPTFGAVKLEIDNWRWQGVPFYLRSGKRLNQRLVEIAIQFKKVPTSIFKPLTPEQLTQNVLKFRIQPDEGIMIQFEAKHPGPKLCMGTVAMDFGYEKAFKIPPPESYVRLISDAMVGDQTLFSRSDEVEQSWRIVDPIIRFWSSPSTPAPVVYPAGGSGPAEADALLQKDGPQLAVIREGGRS